MLYNRDLSWLGFNHRVLQEAKDPDVPLYERLKFLAIFSSNLDEFFRVRYPTVIALSKLDKKTLRKEALLDESDIAEKVQGVIKSQLNEFGDTLINELIPALKLNDIFFYYNEMLLSRHFSQVKEIFLSEVLSFIQPVFLGPDTPYNFLPENNQLYLVVTLKDNLKDTISNVVINIPSKKLKRFYVLEPMNGMHYVVFIDDIIRENMGLLFPGQHISSIYSIKFNRDAEITLDDEYSEKLLDKIEKQLSKRDIGATSRFLFEKGMPANLQFFLASMFGVNTSDMFEGGRYHNLSDLFTFPSSDPTLEYKKEKPVLYPPSTANGDIFNSITQSDVLLHLPYHSYTPVLSFFNQAAVDADVTEIYITLYRVAAESHIVNALISAAKNGKKVTAFIELKARFDEANNIKWSRVMKQAGVKLIYSEPKIKVHSKIALVKKKVGERVVSYAILSTGNFNENTATFYTDHVLLTVDKNVCTELHALFEFLQKKNAEIEKTNIKFSELFVSRFNLLDNFERFIDQEIKKARKGLPALIRIKVNNLEEPYFINLLYKASAAGVKVILLVRGICCLIPELPDLSANITVTRIVDKYLEHTRLFIFGNDEDAVVAIGSSDLMTRNLRRRIEVCIHVKDEKSRRQLLHYFELQGSDNTKATRLLSNMEQLRLQPRGEAINAQSSIYKYIQEISH
ncbi:MAG TPA: polyphosphate kinase 1 [Ferruginibacter sp.]|nr:polyphosphate kinase 1 [Ferruginibacter sp.]